MLGVKVILLHSDNMAHSRQSPGGRAGSLSQTHGAGSGAVEMGGLILIHAVFGGGASVGTFSVPEFKRISLFDSLIMTAVRAKVG